MVRRLRDDYPGAWHHIVNRGLAQRGVFESGRDVATFLELLGKVSAEGLLEVHAYSFLTNHFHILARSPGGRISGAMKVVENEYVRIFNRCRGRDGPLFRSRFCSRPIESGSYWRCVLRYIDRNPLAAGMAERSIDFPHGSAWWYSRSGGPACLRRDIVEECLGAGAAYPVEERGNGDPPLEEFVKCRTRGGKGGIDPLDGLMGASAEWVESWLRRRAHLADGPARSWILVASSCMDAALMSSGSPGDGYPLRPAMLRAYCGLTIEETARRCGVTYAKVRYEIARHLELMGEDPEYAPHVARLIRVALLRQFGPGGPGRSPPIPSSPGPQHIGV